MGVVKENLINQANQFVHRAPSYWHAGHMKMLQEGINIGKKAVEEQQHGIIANPSSRIDYPITNLEVLGVLVGALLALNDQSPDTLVPMIAQRIQGLRRAGFPTDSPAHMFIESVSDQNSESPIP